MDKMYLGDGVYLERNIMERGDIKITTENGVETTNEIFIEPSLLDVLIKYLKETL